MSSSSDENEGPRGTRGAVWRKRVRAFLVISAVLIIGSGVAFLLAVKARRDREMRYRARISRWGGQSQDVFRASPLGPLRPMIGDAAYSLIVGHQGRLVGNDAAADANDAATPNQLAELLEIQPICSANLAGAKALDDAWLAGIQDPTRVIFLQLEGTAITDRSVDRLMAMTGLISLGLSDTALSDESVAKLRQLPKLRRLSVGGPNLKSARLVGPSLVDVGGLPSPGPNLPTTLRGRVEVADGFGVPRAIRVFVRTPGDGPPSRTVPYGWNTAIRAEGRPVEDGRGAWSFSIPLSGLPAGRAIVETWVEWEEGAVLDQFASKLDPFVIELAAPPPGPGPKTVGSPASPPSSRRPPELASPRR